MFQLFLFYVFLKNDSICLICYKNYPDTYFLTIPTTQHKFCKNCVFSYLSQMIDSNQILHIKCPDDCAVVLLGTDIESLLSEAPELYIRYIRLSKTRQLSMNPNICWCVRAGCDQYIERNPQKIHLTCDKCFQEICFLCKNGWHGQRTCEQAMNQELMMYIEDKDVKRCPSCHHGIEKNNGCNHMTCGQCGYQFCWLCLGKYRGNH